jgi:hypothetical protein
MPAPSAIERSRRERTWRPIIRHIPFEAIAAIMTPNWRQQTSPNWMRTVTTDRGYHRSARASCRQRAAKLGGLELGANLMGGVVLLRP